MSSLETAAQPQLSYTVQCPHHKVSDQSGAGCSGNHILVPVHAAAQCAPSLSWASLTPMLAWAHSPKLLRRDTRQQFCVALFPIFYPLLVRDFQILLGENSRHLGDATKHLAVGREGGKGKEVLTVTHRVCPLMTQ